jgi:uncharacterized protein (UPF0332 family)
VAPLNPEHLFQQALKLTESDTGRPRQADLRRAVSSAYYGLFHAVATAASDRFIGTSGRSSARYELVYRSIDHNRLRALCDEIANQSVQSRFVPHGGFGTDLKVFATAVIDLYRMRHDADYNPSIDVTRSEVRLLIAAAQNAFAGFEAASAEQREAFLTLLLFRPRRN